MKTNINIWIFTLSISLFGCIAGSYFCYWTIHAILSGQSIPGIHTDNRPQIADIHQGSTMDEMGANPESTRAARESYKEKPFTIHESPGNNDVLVYLPTFFSLPVKEQDAFSEKLRTLGEYQLEINIFTYSNFETASIQRFYSYLQPSLSSITWRFYDIPSNYYELFRQYGYNMTNKNMAIEFYGTMFPDGFMMSSLIENIDNMLHRNMNTSDRLDSLSFSSEEMGNIWFMLPMAQSGTMTIQRLPTKSLYSDRIFIDSRPGGPGETLSGKEKIEKFFRESTIENIRLDGVGVKENGTITLYGF